MLKKNRFKNVVADAFFASKEQTESVTDFIHFGRAIVSKRYDEDTIKKRMNQLLKLSDYPEFTEDEMLTHFNSLTRLKEV